MSELTNPSYCPCCGEPMPQTAPASTIAAPCPCTGPISAAPPSLHLVDPPRRQARSKARRAATRSKRPGRLTRTSSRPDPAPVAGSTAPSLHQLAPLPLRLAA